VLVVLGQYRDVVESGPPYLPAFLIDLCFLVVLLVIVIGFLDFHGFPCVAHHALHVEVEQVTHILVKGIVLVV
jgi:hypothetical protein